MKKMPTFITFSEWDREKRIIFTMRIALVLHITGLDTHYLASTQQLNETVAKKY